jgi:hypothetical protein
MTEPAADRRISRARSGVVLQVVEPSREIRGMVKEIESLRLSHFWLTDFSLHARNCDAYLTLASAASSQLLFGTAVTNRAIRHPAIATVAGIGAGDRPPGFGDTTGPAQVSSVRSRWREMANGRCARCGPCSCRRRFCAAVPSGSALEHRAVPCRRPALGDDRVVGQTLQPTAKI